MTYYTDAEVPMCRCGTPWPAGAIKLGAICIDCGEHSPAPLVPPVEPQDPVEIAKRAVVDDRGGRELTIYEHVLIEFVVGVTLANAR